MSESETVYSALAYLGIFAGAIGAATGAGVSAFVNYFKTKREFKTQTQVTRLEKRLAVYSFLIYHLDEMLYHHKGLTYTQRRDLIDKEGYAIPKEWEKIIMEIDDKLRDNYFLFDHDILELWTWAKTQYFHPIALDIMPDLRNRLIENYNETATQYSKELGLEVSMIHQKALEIEADYCDPVTKGGSQTIQGIVLDSNTREPIIGVKIFIQIIDEKNAVLSNEYRTTDNNGKFLNTWNVDANWNGELSIILRASRKGYDIKLLKKSFRVNDDSS